MLDPGAPATHRIWRLTYPNGRRVEVHFSPPATRDRVLATYVEAFAAEPYEPPVTPPEGPLSGEEETTIKSWLAAIGEDDDATIGEVLAQCRRDGEAQAYFLRQAGQVEVDDRSFCRTCRNFRGNRDPETGYCTAYQAHVVNHPPRRCIEYLPRPGDPDQRSGRERWSTLPTRENHMGMVVTAA
jgi:hypothetical protein